ncbi:alpha/beta hydrolase [bacterium]|nr:alpha/beta hydrolase [bacterium]MBU1434682.1 alpha/beta hydrolase [bacterium]MBU1502669.1 alpha/beta hydrolase [bacterium]
MTTVIYLHGFASSPDSKKSQFLEKKFSKTTVHFSSPACNTPDFGHQLVSRNLKMLDSLVPPLADGEVFLSGSSLGGLTAALWAHLNPGRCSGLFLICPAFDLTTYFSMLIGEKYMKIWESTGFLPLPGDTGQNVPVHWEFIADLKKLPQRPPVSLPCTIIHGKSDSTIPVESSRRCKTEFPHIKLVETEDAHAMSSSYDIIWEEFRDFLALT